MVSSLSAEHKIGKSIEGLLVDSDGNSIQAKLSEKKYVIFYFSAAWCGPCQKFTPQLVDFYNKNKDKNFELVFVSSDRDEKSMLKYMKSKKMSFPAVKFSKLGKANLSQFAGRGIPFLAMVDGEGKAVVKEVAWGAINKIEKILK